MKKNHIYNLLENACFHITIYELHNNFNLFGVRNAHELNIFELAWKEIFPKIYIMALKTTGKNTFTNFTIKYKKWIH